MRKKATSTLLLQVQQKRGETLRDYFKRFQVKRLEVEDLGNMVVTAAITAGLNGEKLSDSLIINPVTDYQLMAQARALMDAEESHLHKRAAQGEASKAESSRNKKAESNRPESNSRSGRHYRTDQRRDDMRVPAFTPLNAPLSKILY